MARKTLIILVTALLILGESVYFARQCAAGLFRLAGERAFYRNDHEAAWRAYGRALALGGDREKLETDRIELLLFGLDQLWAGARVHTALPPEDAVREALRLVARRIAETPAKAYVWALASDVYFQEATLRHRSTELNLSLLGDDLLGVLRPEDRLGLAALKVASQLEPHNFVYHDLLAEKFLELGSAALAAPHVRRAVAAYPALSEHGYLLRPELDPTLMEAAIGGFEDSLRQECLVPAGIPETDAGELLRRNGQEERAVEFLERATRRAPNLYEAHCYLGVALYTLKRYEESVGQLREASRCMPESPSPHVHMGMAFLELGDLPSAIEQFRSAREKGGSEFEYFRMLGDVLEKAGQIREAERQFVAGANLNPNSTPAWAALLFFYTRHRDLRPVPDVCARLETMSPGDSSYREHCTALGLETR